MADRAGCTRLANDVNGLRVFHYNQRGDVVVPPDLNEEAPRTL